MNKFDQMRDAIQEAQELLRAADNQAQTMAYLLCGRVRNVGPYTLITHDEVEIMNIPEGYEPALQHYRTADEMRAAQERGAVFNLGEIVDENTKYVFDCEPRLYTVKIGSDPAPPKPAALTYHIQRIERRIQSAAESGHNQWPDDSLLLWALKALKVYEKHSEKMTHDVRHKDAEISTEDMPK